MRVLFLAALLAGLPVAAGAERLSGMITKEDLQDISSLASPSQAQLQHLSSIISAGDRTAGRAFVVRTFFRRIDADGSAVFGNVRGTIIVTDFPSDKVPDQDRAVVLAFRMKGLDHNPDPDWRMFSSGRVLGSYLGMLPCYVGYCEEYIVD